MDEFSFLNQNEKKLKENIKEIKKNFSNFKQIVLLGTGVSSLGSKAILEAGSNEKVIFIENIDPHYVLKKINGIKEKKLLLIIISKSGETTEVISLYQLIINYFPSLFNLKKNIIIITEEKNSTLYKFSKENSITVIKHNDKIGGRFSCFSETGLIPVRLASLDNIYIKNVSNNSIKIICIKIQIAS